MAVLLLSWVAIAVPTFALLAQDAPADLLKIADEMTQKVARLRGMEPTGPIWKGVESRAEISTNLRTW